ncbi:hypothetical protein B0H13DRAFT_1992879 [Mycena leptocephala]|nr:hypothetical protein B0H13DRAFT_1992879 [Mycena leptocephala]
MPLFGSSHDNKLEKRAAATELEGTGYNTGHGVGRTHETYPATGTGAAGLGEPGVNPATIGGRHHVPAGHHGVHNDGMMADPQHPPSTNISNQHQPRSGGGGAMTGKIEHVSDPSSGANLSKPRASRRSTAENEAGVRRERAVAHGAHPDNRHVGGLGAAGGLGGTGGPGAYN